MSRLICILYECVTAYNNLDEGMKFANEGGTILNKLISGNERLQSVVYVRTHIHTIPVSR